MEVINSVIVVVAAAICAVLCAYVVNWTIRKRIKPAYVRRNVMKFAYIHALVLVTAMIANQIVMCTRGIESSPLSSSFPVSILMSLFLGIYAKGILFKNFVEGVVIGIKCTFVISNIYEEELRGYAVLEGNNWLPAKVAIEAGEAKKYEEKQQVAAVICSDDPDDKFITVRI